ncbi:MAG: hypothetical protein WC310_03595 [Patescibacteria group bacterium]|jgi:hypothetical protein
MAIFDFLKKKITGDVLKVAQKKQPEVKIKSEDIHVMPEKFFIASKQGMSSKTKIIIAIAVVVLLFVIGAIFFSVDWSDTGGQNVLISPNINVLNTNQDIINGEVFSGLTEQVNSNLNINELNSNININAEQSRSNENINNAPSVSSQSGSAVNTTDDFLPPIVFIAGKDTDADNLTDLEEAMYGTSPNKPDTDLDSYLDGQEVAGGYDPMLINKKITDSSQIKKYFSQRFSFAILYPAKWTYSISGVREDRIIFSSADNETINLSVIDGQTSLEEWYRQNVDNKQVNIPLRVLPNGDQVITSLNGLAIYTKKSGINIIYSLVYQPNSENEVNYKTTFEMMAGSIMQEIGG